MTIGRGLQLRRVRREFAAPACKDENRGSKWTFARSDFAPVA